MNNSLKWLLEKECESKVNYEKKNKAKLFGKEKC